MNPWRDVEKGKRKRTSAKDATAALLQHVDPHAIAFTVCTGFVESGVARHVLFFETTALFHTSDVCLGVASSSVITT